MPSPICAHVLRAASGLSWLLVCALLCSLMPRTTRAQAGDITPLLVTVTQSDSTPLPDANVGLEKSGTRIIFTCNTDQRGQCQFLLPVADTGRYVVTARKIGYQARSLKLLIRPAGGAVSLGLPRTTTQLDTVTVTAKPDKYFLRASDITASSRPIDNVLDALRKLRPGMLGDRARMCPYVKNLWINGQRVWWDTPRTVIRTPPIIYVLPNGPSLDSMLTTIHAKHVAEIRYVNCWDISQSRIGTNDALYITLKPGVAWSWNDGSYVADSALFLSARQPPP